MALRSELNPFRALAATLVVIALGGSAAGATETTPTATTKPKSTTTATKPAATTTTAATTVKSAPTSTTAKPQSNTAPSVADAKRAAAKKAQHAPVMTTANAANVKQAYPWSSGTKTTAQPTAFKDVKSASSSGAAVHSPGYAMTVTAPRTATPPATPAPKTAQATATTKSPAKPTTAPVVAQAKPVTPTTAKPTTVPVKTQASATFSERMAKTTVTPPVMSSGAKATNATPAKTTAPLKSSVPAPKVAQTAPKSPPQGAKPGWFFRQVVASSSSTAKPVGAVALNTVKPTASWSNQNPPAPATTVAQAKPAPTTKSFQNVKAGSSGKTAAVATPEDAQASLNNPKKANPKAPLTTSVQSLGAAFMEQREQYVYNSLNRRDPFASLVSGTFEGEVGTPLLDVSSMKLVGIVWGSSDKFALVEDGHGHGFVLRVGDPVLNGYIAGLTKQELIVKQSSYGDTQTVTIQLQRKEGASNE